jgi:hypothetical protein
MVLQPLPLLSFLDGNIKNKSTNRKSGGSSMLTISIKDESLQGTRLSWQLEMLEEQTTLREIIRRLYQDISEYQAKKRSQLHCLLPPTSQCQTSTEPLPQLDWQRYYKQAINAFEKRSYIVIIDDKQVTHLDTPITLNKQSTVTFLKLIPLIGG